MNPLFGVIGILILIVLIFMGVPVAFAMAFVGFIGFAYVGGFHAAVNMMGLVPYSTVASFVFSVLPLFVLMGEFSSSSGIVKDAYNVVYKWLGRLPGGLAMATVGGSAGFAAVCGASTATAATMTRIALPEMREYNYAPSLATGSLAAGGTMGILIPPSTALILYGLIAEESIGRLFMAGIIPGILEAAFYMITIYILCKVRPQMGPPGPSIPWRQRILAVKDIWGLLVLFVLVMGGIWGGIFTPTEAGSIGAIGAFLLVLGRKRLTRQNLTMSFMRSVSTTGMAFAILIGAMIFSYFIAATGLPWELSGYVSHLNIPPLGILVAILLLYLILGCFLSSLAVLLLVTPIFLPLIGEFGFNLIWFGILITRMTEIGMITPPVGINVFVIKGMAKDIPMYTIFRGIIPFLGADIVHVALLVAIPAISLFLPDTMLPLKQVTAQLFRSLPYPL